MKIPIILLIFVMCFGTFFYAHSNAILGPPAPLSDPSIPEITVQIQVRNSDGVLVTYIEPTIFYHSNMYLMHKYLDLQENKKNPMIIDGESYVGNEQFELEFNHVDHNGGQRASYSLWQDGIGFMTTRYNGFIGEPGDLQTISWKIIRAI